MEIITTVIIILLIAKVIYLSYLYVKSFIKIKDLKEELNKQDLDYYLEKIESAGYDYTIKSGKKQNKEKSDKKISKKSKSKTPLSKKSKSKTFKDLLPKEK